MAGKHKKQVVVSDTTVSEKELWDQGIQVTLLIHEGAIVLHNTIACEYPEWNKRESKSRTIERTDKRNVNNKNNVSRGQ